MRSESSKGPRQLREELESARDRIESLEEELENTQQGLNALSLELEERVETRTEELKKAKEDFKSIVENASEGIFRISPDGKEFLLANPALAKKLGYDSVDHLESSITDIASELALDRESYQKLLDKTKTEGSVSGREVPIRGISGDKLWFRFSLQGVGDNGNIDYFEGMADDITAERRLRERLVELHENLDLLQDAGTKSDAYRAALHSAQNLLSLRNSIIYESTGSTLYPVATSQPLDSKDISKTSKEDSVAGDSINKGETIIISDGKHFSEDSLPEKYNSLISVPIGKTGVFQAISTRPDAFTEDDVRLAELLTRHLKQELERITLETKLTELSRRDPLTGLYNRYYFEEALDQEIERSKRYKHSIAFLMIDINGFKTINDNHGHQIGDRVLASIAEILDDRVREADTVVRYGGDEFLVMMPETEKGADMVSSRFKHGVEEWSRKSSKLNQKVSLAIGKSYWYPDDDKSVEKVLAMADRRMYRDKRSGGKGSTSMDGDRT